jgi:hypothetical protein
MSGPSLGKCINGLVMDVAGSGMRLRLPFSVPCGVPVEIYDNVTLIFGEVCRCVPDEGAFAVGVRVTQTLAAADQERVSAHSRS